MNITTRPVNRRFESSELLIDGKFVGDLSVEDDGRLCVQLRLIDKNFLGDEYSTIFGYGDSKEAAVRDAIAVGRQQHAALGKALAELESRVLVTA